MEFIPNGWLPLHAAIEQTGSAIVAGWTGEETKPDIWQTGNYYGFQSDREIYIADLISQTCQDTWGDKWLSAAERFLKQFSKARLLQILTSSDEEIAKIQTDTGNDQIAYGWVTLRIAARYLYHDALKNQRNETTLGAYLFCSAGIDIDSDYEALKGLQTAPKIVPPSISIDGKLDPIELDMAALESHEAYADAQFNKRDATRLAAQARFNQIADWLRKELFDGTVTCAYVAENGELTKIEERVWATTEGLEIFKAGTLSGHIALITDAAIELASVYASTSAPIVTKTPANNTDVSDAFDPELSRRMELLERVREGTMKPDEAEAIAQQEGFAPLRKVPNPNQFDPTIEPIWSLAMAVAWISSRTPEAVRSAWDLYRLECWDWIWREWNVPVDGGNSWAKKSGHQLEQSSRPTLSSLDLAEAMEDALCQQQHREMTIAQARKALWDALTEGKLVASAIRFDTQVPASIPAYEWPYLIAEAEENMADELRYRGTPSRVVYQEATLQRKDIVSIWPPASSSGLNEYAPKPRTKGRPGAKPTYDWESARQHLFELLEHHGWPTPDDPEWSNQASMEKAIADWFASRNPDRQPVASTVRRYVSKFAEDWKSRQAGKPYSL